MIKAVVALVGFPVLAFANSPEWINQSHRQVIGGDIVTWGTGEGSTSEIAQFKARHMAIKSIVDECGIAHKDIIPWNNHVELSGNGYRAFAQISLTFQSCEEAKRAKTDVQKQALENPKLAQGQRIYLSFIAGKHVNDDELTIKAAQDRVDQYWKQEAANQHDDLQDIKTEVQKLRAELAMSRQPIEPIKIVATSSQKKICKIQARQMIQPIMMAAYQGNSGHGNLANNPAALNQMMAQQDLCDRME